MQTDTLHSFQPHSYTPLSGSNDRQAALPPPTPPTLWQHRRSAVPAQGALQSLARPTESPNRVQAVGHNVHQKDTILMLPKDHNAFPQLTKACSSDIQLDTRNLNEDIDLQSDIYDPALTQDHINLVRIS